MARFKAELPVELAKDFEKVYGKTDEIFGKMTQAGAEVVKRNVKSGVPLPEMADHVKLSVTYRTPSDDGINTKVYFTGYRPFKGNRRSFVRRGREGSDVYRSTEGVPYAFLAQIYEYGRSDPSFPKKPFFRKSFKKAQIEKAMLKAQKEASGGIIDE